MEDFMTMESLATWGGLTMAVYMIVAVSKDWIKTKWGDATVRIWAGAWAFSIQLFVALCTGMFTWPWAMANTAIVGLALLNSVGIVISTTGVHEITTDPKAQKTLPPSA